MLRSTSRVMHRNGIGGMPVAVGGEGCYLIDESGRRYLDASGGAAVSCLGHGHPAVIEAIQRQVATMAYAHTAFFTNEPMEELADLLIEHAPEGLSKVYFASGGSEAVEAALKLARHYFVEIGQPQRHRFIARRQSYHGNTLGALAVGGNVWFRRAYEPLLLETSHIVPCYAYREKAPDETDETYGRRAADELEAAILELGSETVIAFVAESVVGTTMGAVPAVPGYFRRIREICNQYGVLLILDEVMCGMGRTGTLHACTQDGVAPDILTIAKGLGAGYQPIGAMLLSKTIDDTLQKGPWNFRHAHTYVGHATACAAALAVQKTLRDEDLISAVRRRGDELAAALTERFADHRHVGDIRGRGLFRGLEFVEDRTSKRPFPPTFDFPARVKHEAMAVGLICYPKGGTIDGRQGDHMLLAPPYIISREQIGELVDKLEVAIDAAVASL